MCSLVTVKSDEIEVLLKRSRALGTSATRRDIFYCFIRMRSTILCAFKDFMVFLLLISSGVRKRMSYALPG
ncbi:unnamed protein product [Urochloa humidicola]